MNVYLKCIVASLFLVVSGVAQAQNVHGVLRVVKGDVQIKSAKTGQLSKARLGAQVFPQDTIITGKDARAKIVMVDNNEINVSPDSQIEIQHYEYDPAAGKKDVLLNVIYGKVRSKVEQKYDGKTSRFQIKTPSAVAGVRGTDFLTSFNKSNGSSQIVTFEGKVEFGIPGPGGSIANPVMVSPGNQATSVAGAPPSAPAPMPKEELAKMDKETKGDTAAPPKAAGERQPADDKEKKDEGKKDEAKKADGPKKEDEAKKADGPKKEDGAKKEGPRRPASVGAGGTQPKSGEGGCSMCGAGPSEPPPPPPVVSGSGGGCTSGICAPPPPPPPPPFPVMPKCDFCNDTIQSGPSKVLIKVRTQ